VLWAAGSWVQASSIERLGPRVLVGTGVVLIVAANALALGVAKGLAVPFMVVAWGIGGAGMGLSYAPLSLVVLGAAEPGRAGAASAALHLSDVVGTAVGTGIGGGIVAFADGRGWSTSSGAALVFLHAVAMTVLALGASRRLPSQVPAEVSPAR
jgi:MFS family permease